MSPRGKEVTIPSLPCLFILVLEMISNNPVWGIFKSWTEPVIRYWEKKKVTVSSKANVHDDTFGLN